MQITVTNTTEKNKKILAEAATFFANILMDPRMVRNITLDIEVIKNLDVEGECIDEDGVKNPRWFTINLRDYGSRAIITMIKTLAHEMVHVKQHAKNELRGGIMIPTRGGLKMTSKWMDKIWKPKGKEDHYYDSPWELEAYGMENGMLYKWQTRFDNNKPWCVN